MKTYLDVFYAPKVIPVDPGGLKSTIYRIWRFNPRGNCFLGGYFRTQEAAQKKLDALLMGEKCEGREK